MKYFKLSQTARLVGELGLSKEQAERRARRVTPVKGKDGVFLAESPIDFKAGEIVGFDEMPKAHYRSFVGGENGDEPTPHDPKTGEPKATKATK